MLKTQFNAVHAAINEEINDVRESVSNEAINNSRASHVYADGSVVLPISDGGLEMIGRDAVDNNLYYYTRYVGEPGTSFVQDDDIIKVPRANKKLLGAYAKMMAEDSNIGKFYGMIIVDNGKKFNPLHPIIAAMIASGEIRLSPSFTLIVYPFREQRGVHDDKVQEFMEEIVKMMTVIRSAQYLPTISYQPSNSLRTDILNSIQNNGDTNINFSERGDSIQHTVIPVQLATTGIVYPYYGLIMSHRVPGGPYESRHLYPVLSGNIDTMSRRNGQTCVGSLNNYAFSSLYVLSNMNIQSMYFSDVYSIHTDDFIAACQKVSAEFLATAVGISTDEDSSVEDEDKNNEETDSCESCSA